MFRGSFVAPLLALALAGGLGSIAGERLLAQDGGKTVADGVYTDAQADRGAASYATACSGCHRADLGGGQGPALKEPRFSRDFADKNLDTLYTKILNTMPRNAPGSLGDSVSLDVVAHILRENGFPAGNAELAADAVPALKVLPGRPKPPPPVGNFSYVETVGCLTQGPGDTWLLTQATTPKSVVTPADSGPKSVGDASGTETFRLLDAMAYTPMAHKGQRMYVRGMLIKVPAEQRITISAFEMVAPVCTP
jgi:mono/diheme cytochrome c family protein